MYVADNKAVYDLTDDDFIVSGAQDPVKVERKTNADAFNQIQVEYLDRNNDYNVAIAEVKDQANIEQYGLRPKDAIKMHGICDAKVAQKVAQQLLQRALYVRNEYEFKLGWKYCLLEPMDIVTLTDAGLGLNKTPVRITEIEEDEEGVLSIKAEDYPVGVYTVSEYPTQPSLGYSADYNVSPGNAHVPVIFEAPFSTTRPDKHGRGWTCCGINGCSKEKFSWTRIKRYPITAPPTPYHIWDGGEWLLPETVRETARYWAAAEKWEEIKQKRHDNLRGGVYVESVGKWFHSTDEARQQYTFMRTLPMLPPETLYLALYKGNREGWGITSIKARFGDWITRKITRGIYSHCEIAYPLSSGGYACYSSSIRDGGVRMKVMPLPDDKWDLIPLETVPASHLEEVWRAARDKKYDWMGAIGTVLKIRQSENKWFCSEFCASVMGIDDGWRFSPNDLAALAKSGAF